jgi:hypothetical protein
MTEREALKLALEALEAHADIGIKSDKAITAIKEALAQPEQEPVAYQDTAEKCRLETVPANGTLFHTTPPQRKPLTHEEIRDALEAEFLGSDEKRSLQDDLRVARAIEAAHGIKELA